MKRTILLLFVSMKLASQPVITGFTSDSLTREPVIYTSIGIVGKPIGTLSNDKGHFELALTSELLKDSLRIWAVGYEAKTFAINDLISKKDSVFLLSPSATQLEEVIINSKQTQSLILGNKRYNAKNCSGFVKNSNNWKGSEAAILAGNKEGRQVRIESFSFYIIQNKYSDSLRFRLMLYEAGPKKYPRLKTVMKKSIVFKVGIPQGEFTLDLRDYNIVTSKDFFISLECLMNEVDMSKFCFAGSNSTPSFVKSAAFERWRKVKGGGADFNVKVSYTK